MAVINGGKVINNGLLEHAGGGGVGVCLAYKSAMCTPLCLHVTDDFKAKHPDIVVMLRWASRRPNSEWCITSQAGRADTVLVVKDTGGVNKKKCFRSSQFMEHLLQTCILPGKSGCVNA